MNAVRVQTVAARIAALIHARLLFFLFAAVSEIFNLLACRSFVSTLSTNHLILLFNLSFSCVFKGIGYPKSANFSIILFYAQNEAVCV